MPDNNDQTTVEPTSVPDILDEVLAAYLRAIEHGENPSRDELLARHPDLASELQEFFADHDRMNRLAQPLCEPTHVSPAVAAADRIRYFGDYEVLEEIARGGMGVVFKARQASLNRTVAIKMILAGQLASPADVERFHTEAEAAAKLDHPGIVPIYEVGLHEGQHYFSMGFVDGQSLSARIANGPRPAREAAGLVRTVAEAIHYAHENGVVHRDLKPGNILIDRQGNPRVADFGLAKLTESVSNLTGTGQILGTPGYMPPEQAAAKASAVGPLSDIYSLGAVLYCLLTGRPPFQAASPLETLMQVQRQEPVSPRQLNSSIPLDLDTIVLKCLEKSPVRRYASAKSLAEELNRYLNGLPILARRIGRAEQFSRWCRREPMVAGLSAAVLATLIAGVSFSAYFAVEESNRAALEAQARNDERLQREEAQRQTAIAKVQTAIAKEQAARAEVQSGIAAINEEKAKAQTLLADRRFYASQMNLAMQAWQAGEMPRVLELLEGQRPGPVGEDLRGFEWHYLWRQCHGGHRVPIKGHTGAVLSLAFTPDGKSLASASWDGTVRLWDAETGIEQRILQGHNRGVWNVAISPDGKTLASSGKETGSLILWNASSGKPIHRIPESVGNLVFSPDGKTLAGGSVQGDDIHAKLWDVATGAERVVIPQAGMPIGFLADGKTLPTVARGNFETGAIHFWDLARRKQRLTIPAPGIHHAALSHDGMWLATSHPSKPIILWDTSDGTKKTEFPDQLGGVPAFSPDGNILAVGNDDRTVNVWDIQSGRRLCQDVHLDPVAIVAFSPDGKMLASATLGGAIKLWDMTPAEDATTIPVVATGLQFSEDGKALLVANSGPTQVIELATGTEIAVLPASDVIAFSGDGSVLASRAGSDRITVQDVRDGSEIANLPFPQLTDVRPSLTLSRDGKMLAAFESWCGDNTVKVWNVATQQLKTLKIAPPESNRLSVLCAEFSPDGKLLAAGFQFQWVTVWDVESGKVKLQFPQNPAMMNVVSLTFSPDNKALAVGTDVGTVTLWEVETGKRLAAFKGHTNRINSLAFSRDGKTLATAGLDMTVRLWDVVTGQERATLTGHTASVTKVQFSPDSNTLATAGDDGILRFWRADDGQGVEVPQIRPNRSWIAELDRACELNPGRPEPLIAKAHYHHSNGETAQAEAAFSAAAPLASDELDQFLQAGWWVVGPYPNELATAYPPELNLDPARPVDGVIASGKTVTARPLLWRHAPSIDFGRVNVAEFRSAGKPCSVYAMTVVYSPSECQTALLAGSDGARRVWLNGELVHESTRAMTWNFDLDRIPVTLRSGRNTILVKVCGNTPQFFITRLEDSLVDRGLALASAGLFDEAAQHLVRAVRRAGNDDHHALRVCAILQAAAGDREAYRYWSTRIWTKFGQSRNVATAYYAAHPLTLAPNLQPDLNRWIAVLERGMTDSALGIGHVRTHLALAHLRCGNPNQALQVVRESPAWGDYYPSLPVLALIYHALDDPTRSLQALRRADTWFDRTIAESLAARSLTASNDAAAFAEFMIFYSEAKRLIEAKEPARDPKWLLITARGAAQQGLQQRAEADFNAAIDMAPNDSELLIARALVFDQLGWDERAVQDFDRALQLQPARVEPLIARAHDYLSRGKAEKAEAAFAAAAPLANGELDQFTQAGWWVVGPYPNELAATCPPELNLDPSQPVDGVVAAGETTRPNPLRWRHTPTIGFGRVNVGELLPAGKACSAYAANVIYSPTERQGALLVGSEGPRRVWVNGQLLHESSESRPAWYALDRVPVTLHTGRNTILIKVAGNTTPQFFFARLDDSAVDHGLRLFDSPLFDEAAERLETALKRNGSLYEWGVAERLAVAKSASEDWQGYRQWRDGYWQTFKNVNDPLGGFWLAHLYSLANEAPLDRDNWILKLKAGLSSADVYVSRQFAQTHMALAHLHCGNEAEALRVVADGEGESFPMAWPTLALIHHRFERPEEARRWLQRADDWYTKSLKDGVSAGTFAPVAPMDWISWTELIVLRREAWSQVLGKKPPEDPWWLLVTAGERARRGFQERADADFKAAVILHPDDPDVWAIRGWIFAELGLLDRAAADLEQAEKFTRQPEQYLTLARAAARSSGLAEGANDVLRRDEFRRRALDAIQKALKAGFAEHESLQTDSALKSIQNLPEFQLLVK